MIKILRFYLSIRCPYIDDDLIKSDDFMLDTAIFDIDVSHKSDLERIEEFKQFMADVELIIKHFYDMDSIIEAMQLSTDEYIH